MVELSLSTQPRAALHSISQTQQPTPRHLRTNLLKIGPVAADRSFTSGSSSVAQQPAVKGGGHPGSVAMAAGSFSKQVKPLEEQRELQKEQLQKPGEQQVKLTHQGQAQLSEQDRSSNIQTSTTEKHVLDMTGMGEETSAIGSTSRSPAPIHRRDDASGDSTAAAGAVQERSFAVGSSFNPQHERMLQQHALVPAPAGEGSLPASFPGHSHDLWNLQRLQTGQSLQASSSASAAGTPGASDSPRMQADPGSHATKSIVCDKMDASSSSSGKAAAAAIASDSADRAAPIRNPASRRNDLTPAAGAAASASAAGVSIDAQGAAVSNVSSSNTPLAGGTFSTFAHMPLMPDMASSCGPTQGLAAAAVRAMPTHAEAAATRSELAVSGMPGSGLEEGATVEDLTVDGSDAYEAEDACSGGYAVMEEDSAVSQGDAALFGVAAGFGEQHAAGSWEVEEEDMYMGGIDVDLSADSTGSGSVW